jgi:hypothetical protein
MKATLEHGPLYHGLSSEADNTTVRPPEDGWLVKKVEAVFENSPPLKSDFTLDTRGKDGRLRLSHVIIESSAAFDGKIGFFSFDIVNDGEGAVGVFLNIRALPEMYKYVPAAEGPFYLKPKERVTFKTSVPDRPQFAPATVVFYSEDGSQAALDTAGFYVPATGKVMKSDEELWKRAR